MNTLRIPVLGRAGLAGVSIAVACSAGAQGPAPALSSAEMAALAELQSAAQARDAVREAICREADAADRILVDGRPRSAQEAGELANVAEAQRAACDAARGASRGAQQRLDAARDAVRKHIATVAGLPAMTRPPAPIARAPWTDVPSRAELAGLIERASKLQARIDKARTAYANPYGPLDRAGELLLAKTGEPTDHESKALQATAKAYPAAGKIRGKLSAAQVAANDAVATSLRLKDCADRCADWADLTGQLLQQLRLADNALAEAEDLFAEVKAADKATFLAKYPNEAQGQKALEFQALLNKYPNATSVLGDTDGATLTAGPFGTRAALKVQAGKVLPGQWRATSLIFSAAAAKQGDTRLYRSADGLNDDAAVTLSSYWMRGVDTDLGVPGLDTLQANGFSLIAGYRKLNYHDPNAVKFGDKVSVRHGTWKAGLYSAHFPTSNNSHVHLVKFDVKRELNTGDEETLCRLPASGSATTNIACITGLFQAPRRSYQRLWTYQYRWERPSFALSPTITYNASTHEKTFHLPWYFLRAGGKENLLTAGLSYDWTSKAKGSVSVFIGAPFTLFTVDRGP